MAKVATAQLLVRRINGHDMTLKLLESDVKALKITLVQFDVVSYDFFDVEMCLGEKVTFFV